VYGTAAATDLLVTDHYGGMAQGIAQRVPDRQHDGGHLTVADLHRSTAVHSQAKLVAGSRPPRPAPRRGKASELRAGEKRSRSVRARLNTFRTLLTIAVGSIS
jgi:hypothetical protein